MEIAIPGTSTVHSRKWGIYTIKRSALFIYQCNRFHPLTRSHQEFASDFLITAFSRATVTSPVSSSSYAPPPPPPVATACFSTAEIESACEARPIASATNTTSSCDTPKSDIDMHPANHHSRKGLSTFARIQLRLARKRERDAVALLRNAEAIC
jgi:hypothetical protein